MKKLALAVAILLCGTSALVSCSSDDKAADSTAPVSEKVNVDRTPNIRWYDLDSVSKHYKLVEKLNADAEASMAAFQQFARQKQTEIANIEAKIQNKLQNNGYLTEASYKSDMEDGQRKAQAAQAALAQREQAIAMQAAEQQQQLIDSINNFLTDYSKKNDFDIIIIKTPGMYLNADFDVTAEIIAGLNARYSEVTDTVAAN